MARSRHPIDSAVPGAQACNPCPARVRLRWLRAGAAAAAGLPALACAAQTLPAVAAGAGTGAAIGAAGGALLAAALLVAVAALYRARRAAGERNALAQALADAQQRAHAAEARLHATIDAMDAGFALYGPDDRLVATNARNLAFYGADAELVRPGATRADNLRLLYRNLAGGADAAGAPDDEQAWLAERTRNFERGSGETEECLGDRWFRVAHRRTASGDTLSVRAEITAWKQREHEVQRLAAVARQTVDGVALLDADGRIEWVNASYERLTGYRLADIRGRRGRDFLTGPLTDPQAAETITSSYDARRPVRIEVQHYTRHGVPVWFEVRSNAYYDGSGTHLGFVQTRFDIGERKAAEAAAAAALADQRRAEARMVQAIESLDAAFSLYDADERLVLSNARNRQLAGEHADRIRPGMTQREVLEVLADARIAPAAGRQARQAFIESLLAEHRAGNLQTERRIAEGWFRITMRRTPLGDVVTLRTDITAAREREAQLEKLSLVASRTANSVVITDRENRIEWVNESFERATGYTMREAMGRTPRSLLAGPATDPEVLDELQRRRTQGVGHRVEMLCYRKGGEPYWCSVERQPIRDASGRIVRWISLSLDVTERRRAEAALRESEARSRLLAAVVQQTSEAVLTKDLDNRITSWNRGAEQLYGYPAARALGQLSHELLNPGASAQATERLLEGVRSGVAEMKRMQHRRADGCWIDVDASHAPHHDDTGQLVGRITLVRDVTAQVRAQQAIEEARMTAEQAQAAMSTFLSNMSHELRTPMHAILSYARLGCERIDRGAIDKTRVYLQRIEQSGDRLLGLLNDLLDLSRLEAGRMPLDAGRHDLGACVERVLAEMGGLARARNLHIERLGPAELPAWFDPARIAQVLSNVIGNALKFSAEGGRIELRLDRMIDHQGREMAQVTVADRGVGIPPDEREHIFDKFVQSSNTRTGAGGTGLGLAISRELVRAHGGEIGAQDNPGGGTRLVFTLPQYDPAALPPAQDDPAALPAA